jgi:hypothetical protein
MKLFSTEATTTLTPADLGLNGIEVGQIRTEHYIQPPNQVDSILNNFNQSKCFHLRSSEQEATAKSCQTLASRNNDATSKPENFPGTTDT